MITRILTLVALFVQIGGCASSYVAGVTAESPEQAAIVIGEGLTTGDFFKGAIPGATNVVGGKAYGEVNTIKIMKINGNSISPSNGNEYWIIPGKYTFDIYCSFRASQGVPNHGKGTIVATLDPSTSYRIRVEMEENGRNMIGGKKYVCNTSFEKQA